MAKRATAIGRRKKSHSHKTKKRLEIKRLMLEAKKLRPKYRRNVQKKINHNH